MLGQDAFVTLRQSRRVQGPPLAHDCFRKPHLRRIKPLAQLRQHVAPGCQRFLHQATARVIEQIEEHESHRTPVLCVADVPGIGQTVPA